MDLYHKMLCGVLIISCGVVNIRSIGEFSDSFLGEEMQSGAGYGLYIVVLAGAMATAGGLLAWSSYELGVNFFIPETEYKRKKRQISVVSVNSVVDFPFDEPLIQNKSLNTTNKTY